MLSLPLRLLFVALVAGGLATTGCAQERGGASPAEIEAALEARVQRTLAEGLRAIEVRADTMDEALRPLPLMREHEKAALRRYSNSAQVERARALGVPRPEGQAEIDGLVRDGRLVRLADSSDFWVLRELDHSAPYVVPAAQALLEDIGRRFQARLGELGLPPLRVEVTSVLRTADEQADLRETNPNAARGVSAHEFGTTFDLAYNSFAAPAQPAVSFEAADPAWLRPYLERLAEETTVRIAAQRSAEIQTLLAGVLRDLQSEGRVMVTLEELQPVFHMTAN